MKTPFIIVAGALLLSAPAFAQSSTTSTTTTITTEQTGKVRSYVMKEKPALGENHQRGFHRRAELPSDVQLRTLPAEVGVADYSYTVVNGQTVLVEPRTAQDRQDHRVTSRYGW